MTDPSVPRQRDGGFTLVEILIAIVLVGVVAAVIVLSVGSLTDKGSSAACSASLDGARDASMVHLASTGAFPATMLQMTSSVPPTLILPTGVTLNTVAVDGNVAGTIASGQGWALTMTPATTGNGPTFACTSAVVATVPAAPSGTAACPGSYTGWVGEYYANRSLMGPASLCRNDASVVFSWVGGGPAAGLPIDLFSARWTRSVTFSAGTYNFTVGSDDGSRLYIDGVLVLDWWTDHAYSTRSVSRTLAAGPHVVVVEFYEFYGLAQINLSWA